MVSDLEHNLSELCIYRRYAMRFAIHIWIHPGKIIFAGLIVLIATACAPSLPTTTHAIDPTSTLAPTEDASIDITLYRGNPQRTGVFDFPAIRSEPSVKWQTKVSSTWLMPPVLADGTLYTGSGDGVIYALDARTGQELWSTGGFGQLENSGAVAGDILVVGGYDQRVRALDSHTGEVLWSFGTSSFVQASPLILEDLVYIATDHALYALDLHSGELQWEIPTGNEGAYMGAPAYENRIIYTTGGKVLLAVDSTSGEELWRIQHDQPFTALAVANQMIYVGNFDGSFYAYDQQTGEEKWKFEVGGIFWAGPAIEGDTVYAGNDDMIYALNVHTGEERWRFQMAGQGVSDLTISDGVLYVSDSSHEFPRGPRHLYAIDAQSGEEVWTFEVVATFLPAPALSEGTIYVTTTGEVYALE
jgi:eukaryotic-like serine/threonine-protein kinase